MRAEVAGAKKELEGVVEGVLSGGVPPKEAEAMLQGVAARVPSLPDATAAYMAARYSAPGPSGAGDGGRAGADAAADWKPQPGEQVRVLKMGAAVGQVGLRLGVF